MTDAELTGRFEELTARFLEIDLRLERLAAACKLLADNDQEIAEFISTMREFAATLGTAATSRPPTNDRQSELSAADRADSPATLGSFVVRGF